MFLGTDLDNTYRDISIPEQTRRQGFYIVGRRGMGKSTLLESLICEDLYSMSGVGVIDPHGSLIDAVITRIPESRVNDVVYLDASDPEYAFGLNLFDTGGLTSEIARSRSVDGVVQTFKKVWGVGEDASWGPLLEDLLANVTHTLMAGEGMTMAEIPALLYKPNFRKRLVDSLENWVVRDFWEYDWDPLRNEQQIRDRRSTTNKVRAFLRDPVLLHILGQTQTTVDFRAVMDERKILLVKLPLGPDVSETAVSLLGSLMIGQLLTAVMGREPGGDAPHFALYCDEFQRFATPAFATLIDETRKYRVSTTIAHQRLDQLDDAYRSSAMGSSNFALFQLTGDDAAEFALQFDVTPPEVEPDVNQWEQVKRGLHPNPKMAELLGLLNTGLDRVRTVAEWFSGVRYDYKRRDGTYTPFYSDNVDYHAVARLMEWLDERISQFFAQSLPVRSYDELEALHEQVFADLTAQLERLYQVEYYDPKPPKDVREGLSQTKASYLFMAQDRLMPAIGKLYYAIKEEPIRTGNRRTVADTRAEFANRLATLSPRTLAVRFWDGSTYQQGIVKMTDVLPGIENPEKTAAIRIVSRERYCRRRQDVDREIRQRRETLEQEPNEPEPALAEQPPLPIRRRDS